MKKLQQALSLHRAGRLGEAKALYLEVLEAEPAHFDALHLLGVIAGQEGDHERAVALFDQAIAADAGNAACFHNRGLGLMKLKRPQAALESFERAIALKPDFADAHYHLGLALQQRGQLDGAVASYDRAIALRPDLAGALYNRAAALLELRHPQAALESFDAAIALQPDLTHAWTYRGVALRRLGRLDEAIESYDRAIALKPDAAGVFLRRGLLLAELKNLEAARESLQHALALDPALEFGRGALLQARLDTCDWEGIEEDIEALRVRIERGEKAATPFTVLALFDSPELLRKTATTYMQAQHPPSDALGAIARRPRSGRIRIGYFSADFRNHSVAFLTAELFERHDRDRFELSGFSFGPRDEDEMRQRISSAFDRFIDVEERTDTEVAALAREMGIDIAVDLGGHTQYSRPGIFAARAAPVQAGYAGYPGTMGASYFDYILADAVTIPERLREHYCEKVAYLPSYQVNDSRRAISPRRFTREELGLPRAGFVFCCLNNSHKFLPATFARWMGILRRVEASVLLAYATGETARGNLRRVAAQSGVDPARIVFAERTLPRDEYLARFRTADLFLDTFPYNAATVACDALWAGLPVLTRMGESFVSRIGGSLLSAIRLPELVTETAEQYEARAIELATNPEKLAGIRARLAQNRLSTPLFDTPLFARNIERVYAQMYERDHAGLPPDHIISG